MLNSTFSIEPHYLNVHYQKVLRNDGRTLVNIWLTKTKKILQMVLSNGDQVEIRIVRANSLIPGDINGSSDPYVSLHTNMDSAGNEVKRRTEIVKKTLDPTWDEVFTFYIYKVQSLVVDFTVWDWDRFTKDVSFDESFVWKIHVWCEIGFSRKCLC